MEIPRVEETKMFPPDYQGAEAEVSWAAMHSADFVNDVFKPGTFELTEEAMAEQAAVIARAEEERRRAAGETPAS